MTKKLIPDRVFWWFALIFSIAMSIVGLFYAYKGFYLYNLKDVKADKFVVKQILAARRSTEQESSGIDYLILGTVLSNNTEGSVYYKALRSFDESFYYPSINDTIDIWFSNDIQDFPIILKAGKDYPRKIFLKRAIIYLIISIGMIGAGIFSIVKIKKL